MNIPVMNTLVTLVRREFWEHRGLWITPLAVGAVLIIGAIFSSTGGGHIQVNGQELSFLNSMNEERRAQMFGIIFGAMVIPHLMVMLVVLFFYLSDALYGERKDRSILFWKSLPVSDASTVLSKMATALIAAPLVVFAAAWLTGLLVYAILSVKFNGTPFASFSAFSLPMWLRMTATIFVDLLVTALWFAPVAAYVLMISGWAKRSVFLWVVLPPVIITIVEKSYFNSAHVGNFVLYRLLGVFTMLGINDENDAALHAGPAADKMGRLGEVLDKLNLSHALASPDLWLGVLAAAAMVMVTIRLRRYRDDTSG